MPEIEHTPSTGETAPARKPGMLVLSRRPGQGVVIDVPDSNGSVHRIQVVFLGSDMDQGRIGFKADREVQILRNELLPRRAPQPES